MTHMASQKYKIAVLMLMDTTSDDTSRITFWKSSLQPNASQPHIEDQFESEELKVSL